MSEFKLKNGNGKKGYLQTVSSRGRAQVDAVSTAEFADASLINEDAYVVISTIQAITTAETEHANLFLKNDADRRIRIHSIRGCADQIQKWRIYKNPTDLSGGGTAMVTNLDFASPKTPTVTALTGGEGFSLTGGSMMEHFQNDTGHSEEVFTGGLLLSRGNAIGLTVEMAAAGDACSRILFYLEQS